MIRFNAMDPIGNNNINREIKHAERNLGLIRFSTMAPSTDKISHNGIVIEKTASPKWIRILSAHKQKVRGENSTKEMKKECKE